MHNAAIGGHLFLNLNLKARTDALDLILIITLAQRLISNLISDNCAFYLECTVMYLWKMKTLQNVDQLL